MCRTIVVPVDPTATSDAAVAVGATVARQSGAEVELLAAVPPEADGLKPRAGLAEFAERYDLSAGRTRVVHTDDVASAILEAAEGLDALVCLDTRARRPVGELVLGSVSEEVVRRSHQPLLLVGPRCAPPPTRFETMIVGLDESRLAEAIVPLAAEWAVHLGVTPWLVQVLPAAVPLELSEDVHESAYLHRLAERLARLGAPVEWDVATAIARFAESRPGGLIALSTHGRSGLGRLTLGSVALEVAR